MRGPTSPASVSSPLLSVTVGALESGEPGLGLAQSEGGHVNVVATRTAVGQGLGDRQVGPSLLDRSGGLLGLGVAYVAPRGATYTCETVARFLGAQLELVVSHRRAGSR